MNKGFKCKRLMDKLSLFDIDYFELMAYGNVEKDQNWFSLQFSIIIILRSLCFHKLL